MTHGTGPLTGHQDGSTGPDDPARPVRRRRRGWLVALVVAVVVLGAGAYVQLVQPYGISVAHPLGTRQHQPTATQLNDAGTSTAVIEHTTLSETTSVNGTLGYAGSYTVMAAATGTITWLPKLGSVIRQGQVLYRVDGKPVVLLYGSVPDYRDLVVGATAADMKGRDVAQLNHDLVALGYVHKADVNSAWDEFNWATVGGVQKLQKHLHVSRTGGLMLGDIVFLPGAARVTSLDATLGGPANGQVLRASSTIRTVTVALSADMQSAVAKGDKVVITLPDSSTTPGVVTSVGAVAALPAQGSGDQGPSDDTPTITVRITPTRPDATGRLDQAPVLVAITEQTLHGVLAVPVSALLARSNGGYAVEVTDADQTHRLVAVTPGLYDDSRLLVQVTGAGLHAGQRVVVAGQ